MQDPDDWRDVVSQDELDEDTLQRARALIEECFTDDDPIDIEAKFEFCRTRKFYRPTHR